MASLTASLHNSNLKKIHVGPNIVTSRGNFAVTGTASTVVFLAKVPDKAVITDFQFYAKDGGTNQTWMLGLQLPEGSTSGSVTVTQSALLTNTSNTGAAGVTTRAVGNKLPYKVSISGEANPKWAWVIAVCGAAISASADLNLMLTYHFDSDL